MAAETAPRDRPSPRWRVLLGTIRFRITAVATVVVAVVLVFAGFVAVAAQRRALTDNLDDRLRQRAGDILALVEEGTVPRTLAGGTVDDTIAQLVDSDGDVVAATANALGAPAAAPAPPAEDVEELRTVDGLSGIEDESFRLLSFRFDTARGAFVLHVAAESETVEESVGVLAVILGVTFPIVLVVLAVIIWLVVGRALRPVESIRAEVARIGGAALDRRVPEPATHDEVQRLAHTMNDMLGRLEDAHRRQQRFVSDASHELRSPLTSIRSELEVDLAHPETADLGSTHRSVLEEVERLQRLVDDLLHLARTDASAGQPERIPVDLDEIVLRVADTARARGRVGVDTSAVSGAQVVGDPERLARAVRNLVENAERHAATTVSLTLGEAGGTVRLTVTDDGPGIPADRAERVFERFARVDDARDRGGGGTGLGLAITREIAGLHGGTVAVDTGWAHGARLVLTLPTRQAAQNATNGPNAPRRERR